MVLDLSIKYNQEVANNFGNLTLAHDSVVRLLSYALILQFNLIL